MTPLERITLALARIAPTPQQRQRLRLAHLAATLAAARGWTADGDWPAGVGLGSNSRVDLGAS